MISFRVHVIAAMTLALRASLVAADTPLTSQLVASGFSNPLMVTHSPGDTQRLFVVERAGKIRLIKNGIVQGTDFLNITSLVSTSVERGLLDLVFHPNYRQNGYFYVRYNNTSGQTTIARYGVSGNPDVANAGSAQIVLVVPQGTFVHNGGSIAFGRDGCLYIGTGDGNNLSNGNSQDNSILLGKILRIDINGDDFPADPNRNYRIPAGNPFAGAIPGADEIWTMGVRNPFRFAFDLATASLWIGDVGEGGPEEIDVLPAGVGGMNLGWPCMEGPNCTSNTACTCNAANLTLPIYQYNHIDIGCAITGGRVYRGCAVPDLVGTYFFADYCTARIISFRYNNGVISAFNDQRAVELHPRGSLTIDSIVGFGEDARGELYICDMAGGEIFKIIPAVTPPDANGNGVPDSCEWPVGDVDHNNHVNVDDLLNVITHWGACVGCPADIAPDPGGSGVVDVDDLLLVITHWG